MPPCRALSPDPGPVFPSPACPPPLSLPCSPHTALARRQTPCPSQAPGLRQPGQLSPGSRLQSSKRPRPLQCCSSSWKSLLLCLCSHLDPDTPLWQPLSYPQARSGGFCGLQLSPPHLHFQSLLPRFLQSRILTQFISVSLKPIMGPDTDGL